MARKRVTRLQGQYLAFIHRYQQLHGVPPAELDIQRYFGVTPPSVHDMIVRLHEAGLISRAAGEPRSIRVRVAEGEIPPLDDSRDDRDRAHDRRALQLEIPATTPSERHADASPDDFPTSEVVVDCCGTRREFALDLLETPGGFFVRALERAEGDDGYQFAAHSETDPYLALGRLRQKIAKGLATRYLTEELGLSHGEARGHVASEGIVIDGRHLSYDQLALIIGAYEGWQISLTIVDAYDSF